MKCTCTKCKVKDDESHCINDCILYRNTNNYDNDNKFYYNSVYSENCEEMKKAAKKIFDIWDLANGKKVNEKRRNRVNVPSVHVSLVIT